jgi:hypothetical protein
MMGHRSVLSALKDFREAIDRAIQCMHWPIEESISLSAWA